MSPTTGNDGRDEKGAGMKIETKYDENIMYQDMIVYVPFEAPPSDYRIFQRVASHSAYLSVICYKKA